jgi:hypothetical protein
MSNVPLVLVMSILTYDVNYYYFCVFNIHPLNTAIYYITLTVSCGMLLGAQPTVSLDRKISSATLLTSLPSLPFLLISASRSLTGSAQLGVCWTESPSGWVRARRSRKCLCGG